MSNVVLNRDCHLLTSVLTLCRCCFVEVRGATDLCGFYAPPLNAVFLITIGGGGDIRCVCVFVRFRCARLFRAGLCACERACACIEARGSTASTGVRHQASRRCRSGKL